MTRKTAREIAIQLGFAAVSSREDISALMDRFFSPEHYETLQSENELYQERPDEKQLAYIRRLTELTMENRSEIDGFIERYAKGWKLERISKTALAVMRCASAKFFIWTISPTPLPSMRRWSWIRAMMTRIPSPLSTVCWAASCAGNWLRLLLRRLLPFRTSLCRSKPWSSRR